MGDFSWDVVPRLVLHTLPVARDEPANPRTCAKSAPVSRAVGPLGGCPDEVRRDPHLAIRSAMAVATCPVRSRRRHPPGAGCRAWDSRGPAKTVARGALCSPDDWTGIAKRSTGELCSSNPVAVMALHRTAFERRLRFDPARLHRRSVTVREASGRDFLSIVIVLNEHLAAQLSHGHAKSVPRGSDWHARHLAWLLPLGRVPSSESGAHESPCKPGVSARGECSWLQSAGLSFMTIGPPATLHISEQLFCCTVDRGCPKWQARS